MLTYILISFANGIFKSVVYMKSQDKSFTNYKIIHGWTFLLDLSFPPQKNPLKHRLQYLTNFVICATVLKSAAYMRNNVNYLAKSTHSNN